MRYDIKGLILRYIIALVLPVSNLYLFYLIFTPLTVYPASWILGLFYDSVLLSQSSLLVSGQSIDLVQACIAGAAYYLLMIVNLSTPMPGKTRAKSLIFLALSFLIVNIVRIVVFTSLHIEGFRYFNTAHLLFWYLGSTLLVVLLWFFNAWLFKIKDIPIYTDMGYLIRLARRRR